MGRGRGRWRLGRAGGCTARTLHIIYRLHPCSLLCTCHQESQVRWPRLGGSPFRAPDIVGFLIHCTYVLVYSRLDWSGQIRASSFAVINLLLFAGHRFPSLAVHWGEANRRLSLNNGPVGPRKEIRDELVVESELTMRPISCNYAPT